MNLTNCRVCGGTIDRLANNRLRKYCSTKCRDKFHYMKAIASGYSRDKQREYQAAKANKESTDKKRCAICGLWYRRVAAHVAARHQMNAYEYKKYLGIRTSRGIMTAEDREHMRKLALAYKMDEQLKKAGQPTRFVQGGEKQRMKKPNAGRTFIEDEYS